MSTRSADPAWLSSPQHDGLVSLGTHSIYCSISGPPRNSKSQPLIIIQPGLGCSQVQWVVVARQISPFARVFLQDRSGLGRSTCPPDSEILSAAYRAKELKQVLQATGLAPPYVLVSQSYGGTIAREFLRQSDAGDVAGMVFVDASPLITPPPGAWHTLLGPKGFAVYPGIIGLESNHVFSPEEYQATLDDEKASAETRTGEREMQMAGQSQTDINEAFGMVVTDDHTSFSKQPLGKGRLSVIKGNVTSDMQKVLEYGIENGYGTEEEREELSRFLETWDQRDETSQRALLDLSADGRFVAAQGSGRTHHLHYTQPEFIVEEVRWVLGESVA